MSLSYLKSSIAFLSHLEENPNSFIPWLLPMSAPYPSLLSHGSSLPSDQIFLIFRYFKWGSCLKSLQFSRWYAAKSLQSCPTLCDPIDGSPPGSPVPGILQAKTLEWVAISFSNAWKWKVKVKSLSCVRPLATPWTAAHQAPPSLGFFRQEYWSGLPLPSPLTGIQAII